MKKLVNESLVDFLNESAAKDADNILYAVRNKNQKGYSHLYKKLLNELERAGVDKVPNFDSELEEVAFILYHIYKHNYGKDNLSKYITDKEFDDAKDPIAKAALNAVKNKYRKFKWLNEYWDDERKDPDALSGHTINGEEVTWREFWRWQEEEGEWGDDPEDHRRRPRY